MRADARTLLLVMAAFLWLAVCAYVGVTRWDAVLADARTDAGEMAGER